MSRMTSMFSFTARTLGWILSARSTGSYFHRQDRMRLLFFTRKTTNSLPFFSRLYSTSAVGYTDQQTSRLYRPVSVVSHLCSNSSCPCVSNLSNLFVCNVCGFLPFERWLFFSMRLLWWINVYTLMCFCLLLLVSVRLAFSSCVIALFFTWFVLRFTSFS